MTEKSRRQAPWNDPADVIALPATRAWAPQEHWAWARILRGLPADMSDYPGDKFPVGSAEWLAGADDGQGWLANEEVDGALRAWPEHRKLSAAFLDIILLHDAYVRAPVRRFVRISSAIVEESLDWQNERIGIEIGIYRTRFAEPLVWHNLRIDGVLNISGCRFEKKVTADGAVIDGDLFCRDDCRFLDELRLVGARIHGDLSFSGAIVQGALSADRIVIGGGLFCNNGFHAQSECRFLGGRINGDVLFAKAQTGQALMLDSLHVEGNVFLIDDFIAHDEVRMVGMHVKGTIGCTHAEFRKTFNADNIVVEGQLFLRQLKALHATELTSAKISGDIQFSSSRIYGVVDLTNAKIGGELQTTQGADKTIWGPDAALILRNTRIGALAGNLDSFRRADRRFIKMDLSGLHYARLGGLGAAQAQAGSLANEKAEHLITWVAAGHAPKTFTPEPYRQLAAALIEAGHANAANRVLHAMRIHERACERNLLRKAMLSLSGAFIGFGHRNDFAFYWFTLLVIAAAAGGLNWYGLRPLDLTQSGIDEFLRWLAFAFGNAIPIINLDKSHETFLADKFAGGVLQAVPVAVAWAFYIQKIAGFVILSYLAAGLTGLASRQKE